MCALSGAVQFVTCLLGEYALLAVDVFFFFNDTATTEIYTLSLHDALPISLLELLGQSALPTAGLADHVDTAFVARDAGRSEEHTSELQSLAYLVCRLLLEKKKKTASRPSRPSPGPNPQRQRCRSTRRSGRR